MKLPAFFKIPGLTTHELVVAFIACSVATYLIAGWLWHDGHPIEAAEVVWWSPFPCPPGVPC